MKIMTSNTGIVHYAVVAGCHVFGCKMCTLRFYVQLLFSYRKKKYSSGGLLVSSPYLVPIYVFECTYLTVVYFQVHRLSVFIFYLCVTSLY